jgi:hypothetical protein
MDGARADERAAGEMAAKLSAGTISPWTVAELFLLGDGAVAELEQLARGAFGPALERRSLGPKILAAIGTPSARAALRRLHAAWASAEDAVGAVAANDLVSRGDAFLVGDLGGDRQAESSPASDANEMRGSDVAA